MPLTKNERLKLIRTIRKLVPQKHINVANPQQDYTAWIALVDERTKMLIDADGDDFDKGIRDLLGALGSSHTAFFHETGQDVPPHYAINATLRAVDTPLGKRWMFLDVIEDGAAHRAGIQSGQILLSVDAVPLMPPQQPRFRIGGIHRLALGMAGEESPREITIEIPNRAAKDRPPMIEPRSVFHRMLDDELGYLRVATFPGAVRLGLRQKPGNRNQ